MRRKITRWVIWYMVTVMFLLGITPRVEAAFSPSEVIGQQAVNRIADLEKIQKVIQVKMIRERLNALGLSQEEIQARLNQMSNDQVHQLAVNLDEMKVAGDDAVTVLIVLVIVAIAILLVYLMGYRLILKKG
jgi:Family of unknown function (DUF6627)